MSRLRYAIFLLFSLLVLPPAGGEERASDPERDNPVEEVTVVEKPQKETDLVGPNRQPEWTTRRRFAVVDAYVQSPWQFELSQGWALREPGEDGQTLHQLVQEIELGLPYRLQVDLELVEEVHGGGGEFSTIGVEGRWALADWGEILMNPTIYGEWEFNLRGADRTELRLLFADTVTPRLYTAVNLFYEQEIGGDHEQEFAVSNAWTYSLIERVLGAGVEVRFAMEKEGGEFEPVALIGPSTSWRITDELSLVAAPLFGVTEESPDIESFVYLRYYFGGEDGDDSIGGMETPSMEAR